MAKHEWTYNPALINVTGQSRVCLNCGRIPRGAPRECSGDEAMGAVTPKLIDDPEKARPTVKRAGRISPVDVEGSPEARLRFVAQIAVAEFGYKPNFLEPPEVAIEKGLSRLREQFGDLREQCARRDRQVAALTRGDAQVAVLVVQRIVEALDEVMEDGVTYGTVEAAVDSLIGEVKRSRGIKK